MLNRTLFILLALAAPAGISRGAAPEAVRYTVRFPEAKAHYAEVDALVPTEGRPQLAVFLPVWTPGSYLVREFSRHLEQVTATAEDGTALTAEKTAKNRWSIASGSHPRVRLHYRVYGREVGIRGNWMESDFAFLNGAAIFVAPVNLPQRAYEVKLELPAGWRGAYTALDPTADPTRFTAPDYDTLVDSPILAGSPQVDSFAIDGVPHHLVTLGGDGVWDNALAARGLARVAQTQRDFWGALPTARPVFIFNLLTGTRSGLEHGQGFVISADRWIPPTPAGLTPWLSLASHEYFHLWNGKRLRPAELGPFDYEHEVYTRSIWSVEGITSYYQHLMLRRAGITSTADFLDCIGGGIAGTQDRPGRLAESLAAASFDAWIKTYRSDEDSPNTTVSYYVQGTVAALLLDAEIRRASHGAKSLDDLMRQAYARHSGATGYTAAEFAALASEVAGADLSGWFARVIDGTGEYDYQPMLDWFGLAFEPAPPPAAAGGNSATPKPPAAWLGAQVKDTSGRLLVTQVRAGTPASAAGLSADDEILALGDYRVRADQLPARLAACRPGDKVSLLVARLDHLVHLEVTLGAEPVNRWKLSLRKDATPEQTAHLNAWLGADQKPG